MTSDRPLSRPLAAALILLGLVLYAWPLTLALPLTDPDEGLHAAIAQEMVERHEWVVPRIVGQPFLDKPILYFWALASSIRGLGPSEAAVRLPGLLFGLLGTLTTAWLAAALAGRPVAVLAGAIYATLLLPIALNQAAVHDVALVPWTNLMMMFLWRAQRGPGGRQVFASATLAGLFVGLAALTKGLVGVAIVGLPFTMVMVLQRRLDGRLVTAGAWSLLVGALVAAPWYAAMETAQPGYLRYFFLERHVLGFSTTTQIHGGRPWWYYLPIMIGGAVPWVVYLPFARAGALPGRSDVVRLLWVWLVAGVGVLSVAGSKLVTYVLPLFPPVAILAAIVWHRWLGASGGPAPAVPDRAQRVAVLGHASLVACLIPATMIAGRSRFGIGMSPLVMGGEVVVIGACLAAIAWHAASARRALATLVGTMGLLFATVMAGPFADVAGRLSARDLAGFLNQRGELPETVWTVDERVGSVVFYLEPALRRQLTPGRIEHVPFGELRRRLTAAPEGTLVVIADADLVRLDPSRGLEGVPCERAGRHRVYAVSTIRTALTGRGYG